MNNAELEEVLYVLHRRIALTTAGTPLQDDLIKAVGALRIAVNRIAELEAQIPKEGEWIVTTEVSDDGAVTSHINCSRCGFYWREPKHGKAFKRCPNCGAKMKG